MEFSKTLLRITELDWIIANSKNQVFFYDSAQSVKPSDIAEERFTTLLNDKKTIDMIELQSFSELNTWERTGLLFN